MIFLAGLNCRPKAAVPCHEAKAWLRLEDAMSVQDILRKKGTEVATIAPDVSIKRAADWLRAKNIGALVVTRGDTVLGLVSEREIVHAMSRHGENATSMPVSEIMRH